MAAVISQGVFNYDNGSYMYAVNGTPVTHTMKQKESLNSLVSAFVKTLGSQKGKTLGEIIDTIYGELPRISGLTLSEPDQNGNITATLRDDIRLALALGITNTQANNIVLFGRQEGEKEFDANGNKNPNLDLVVAAKAILSKGSTSFKAGDDYLTQVLRDISFTGKYAYELTDASGDSKHIIMPVFAGTTESAIQIPSDKKIQTVAVQEFAQMNPGELTAKAEAYRQYMMSTLSK